MKTTILFFTAFLLAVPMFGQEKETVKAPFPFDEFSISVNRTNMNASGTENRFGGGAGFYHSSELSKQWSYVYGLEYNYTSLFVEHVRTPPNYTVEKNITFHIHTVSLMPLAFRFNMGKNIKYFLESGIPLGVSAVSKKGEAYLINPVPSPENPWDYKPVKPEGDMGFSGGILFGIGMLIPMNRIEWIVKADYTVGKSQITHYETYQYYRLGVGIRKGMKQ